MCTYAGRAESSQSVPFPVCLQRGSLCPGGNYLAIPEPKGIQVEILSFHCPPSVCSPCGVWGVSLTGFSGPSGDPERFFLKRRGYWEPQPGKLFMRSPSPGLPTRCPPRNSASGLDYLEDVKAYMAPPTKASWFRVPKAYGNGNRPNVIFAKCQKCT